MSDFARPVVLSAGSTDPAALLVVLVDAGVPTGPGRLDGVAMMVAQGDADVVIPRELLDRMWAYLHDESRARLLARREPGGHGLTWPVVEAVADWLQAVSDAMR
jgi:phospholipase/carboxylesterase